LQGPVGSPLDAERRLRLRLDDALLPDAGGPHGRPDDDAEAARRQGPGLPRPAAVLRQPRRAQRGGRRDDPSHLSAALSPTPGRPRPPSSSPSEGIVMSKADADRNLLFGLLALQMDLVSRDALIAGFNSWVLRKHTPLGQVLVEQGALSGPRRDLLESLV